MDASIPKIKLSDIGDRFFASLVDGVVTQTPIAVLFYTTTLAFPVTALFGLLFHAGYYIVCHSAMGGGQTVGKRLTGLRVISMDGQWANLGQSTVRFLIFAPPIIAVFTLLLGLPIDSSTEFLFGPHRAPFILATVELAIGLFNTCFYLVNPQGRAWHDMWAKTIVLKTGRRIDASAYAQCISEKTRVIKSGRWMVCGLLVTLLAGIFVMYGRLQSQHPDTFISRSVEDILKLENIHMTKMKFEGERLLLEAKYPYSTWVRIVEESAVPSRLLRAVEAMTYLELIDVKKTASIEFDLSTQPDSKPSWHKIWKVNADTLEIQALEAKAVAAARLDSKPVTQSLSKAELDAQLTPFLHKNWDVLTEEMKTREGLMTKSEISVMVQKLREAVVEKARRSDPRIIQTEDAYDNFQKTPELFDVALKCKKAIHTMTDYLKLINQYGAKTVAARNILDVQMAYFTAAEARVEKHIVALSQKQ